MTILTKKLGGKVGDKAGGKVGGKLAGKLCKKMAALVVLLFSACAFLFADFIIDEDFGFSLDIPEGYELADMSDDSMTLMFTHPNLPVTFLIRIYDDSYEYSDSQQALAETMKKLSATYDSTVFDWSDEKCAVSLFETSAINKQADSGWAVAAPVADDGHVVLITYAPKTEAEKCQDFMISTINSLCIKDDFYNVPGIITTFAFPVEGDSGDDAEGGAKANSPIGEEFTATIGGKKIKSQLAPNDGEAAQFVINLEYRILNYYGQHNLWMEAWQRYYKLIYRDSYGRLAGFAQQVLDAVYPAALKARPENPDIQFAQYILSWVQQFPYVRATEKSESDFSNLPDVLLGTASDCDNRSLLVCMLLEYAGIDSMLLVSPTYAHAMAATSVEAPGQTFTSQENGQEYIVGETTAPVTWGMMAENQADRTQWFQVTFR